VREEFGGTAGDDILTYGYVKPREQWFPTKDTPSQPLQDRPGAQGLYPSGMLARTLRRRNLIEPKHIASPAQGSRAHPSLRFSTDNTPMLDPWLLPGLRCQPRTGHKKTSPKSLRLRGSQTLHFGCGLAGRSRDRVMHGV
jgi:hypothetical protein